MKVLLIDVNYKHSSTGKIVHDLYQGLRARGHEAAVCYGRGPQEAGENIYKFGLDIETYFHALMTRLVGLTGYFSPISTYRLLRFIKKFDPDVIHIHELHAYFVNIKPIITYIKKKGIKIIWTFHCEFMYTGKCGHANDCENWKTTCGKCPQLQNYPKSWFLDFTKKMFLDKKKLMDDFDQLTIVTPSQWLADRVSQSFLSTKEIIVIHNGIDTDNIFHPRDFEHLKKRHGLTNEKIVLAVAPNLMSEGKGGRWVVQLAKRFEGQNVKFILIGVNDLQEKFEDNIIALGRTDNQIELAEYYSMAYVTLLMSSRETFSLICAESIACGTPVVGFESAPESVFKPPCATFVKYGDLDAISYEVMQTLKNEKDRNTLATFGSQKYGKNSMVKKYMEQYHDEAFSRLNVEV